MTRRASRPASLNGELERTWADVANVYLPGQVADSLWRFSPVPSEVPRQGWKVHVSATIANAAQVLRTVGPILAGEGLVFKGVSSVAQLSKLNCGLYYGYPQIGKFLTVYPPSPRSSATIGRKVARALVGQAGPAVPYEQRVLEGSPVFARFGLFHWNGQTPAMLLRPDGTEQPDRRDANPEWAESPKGLFTRRRRVTGPLSDKYRAYGFISQRGKGGVYRALDLVSVPPRHCVLKEGRRHGETDLDGHDGFSRVSQEVETLSALAAEGIAVPRMYASFEQAGHKYLVLEWMPGGSLAERLYPPDLDMIALPEALNLCRQASTWSRRYMQPVGCGVT